MADAPETTDKPKPDPGEPEVSATAAVPPKRLGWLWTILLLGALPAVGVGLWYGGTRHRVDDHPKKVKRTPRRLVPKGRVPMARPAMTPTAAPAMTPTAPPAMTTIAPPVMTPTAAPAMTPTAPPAMTPTAAPAMTPTAAPEGGMK